LAAARPLIGAGYQAKVAIEMMPRVFSLYVLENKTCCPSLRRLTVGCSLVVMSGMIEKVKQWFRPAEVLAEEEAEGGEPVAVPPPGHSDDPARETSTNAQTAGASDEPWPGNG
jgi:hypothetical protein